MNDKPSPDLTAMTLNERLFVAGLMERWDTALAAGDRKAMIGMLEQVQVADATRIVDNLLKGERRPAYR